MTTYTKEFDKEVSTMICSRLNGSSVDELVVQYYGNEALMEDATLCDAIAKIKHHANILLNQLSEHNQRIGVGFKEAEK